MPFAETIELPTGLADTPAVKVLQRALTNGRLAHAILIHGDDFSALEQVAHALAQALLHTRKPAAQHPDFHTLRPAKKMRQIRIGENGEEENTMRYLLRVLNQTASAGDRKVALIYEADRMNTAAANAFLKTLEEPPVGTTLLLLTTRPYDLLATIRSRCFRFRIPGTAEIAPDPAWDAWVDDYSAWLKSLRSRPVDKKAIADRVLAVYGLVTRFNALLEFQYKAIWAVEKTRVTAELDDEEWDALQVGVRKGLRASRFVAIEHATREYAIDEARSGAPLPANPLSMAVTELEKVTGLLDVNLKEEAALEHFLLASLRIWTPRG
ncbi:MAG: DNA polymerase III subunit gamma/tau [Verrucomicrobiota bacterium]|nr:DNA polymerase III subunit gamma/tau [Verrucomicrobiota bacterium]